MASAGFMTIVGGIVIVDTSVVIEHGRFDFFRWKTVAGEGRTLIDLVRAS